jgi:CDP-4-dehydro-6-deoxyglucose reductase, E1
MAVRKDWFFPTAFSYWGDEEQEAISRVIESGRFTQGEEVEAFEQEFAAYHGMPHAIMCNSGSSANLIAIASLAQTGFLDPNKKVVVPAIAWATTYAPLVQHGLDLILADVDASWNADVFDKRIEKALAMDGERDDPQIGLIVAASILGFPANLSAWKNIAGILGVPLIEDNCESLGARTTIGVRLCGTFGLLSTFSLFYSHQISAIEGGVILTKDVNVANTCRMLRAHGWTRDVVEPEGFEKEYNFVMMGYNVRGLELHAAIAREQLKKLETFMTYRRRNMENFRKLTEHLPINHPSYSGSPSPFGLHFTVGSPSVRRELVAALRANDIDCRLPTGGSFRKHLYGKPWSKQETPRADHIHDCGMFLGNAPYNIEDKIARAVEVMTDTFKKGGVFG